MTYIDNYMIIYIYTYVLTYDVVNPQAQKHPQSIMKFLDATKSISSHWVKPLPRLVKDLVVSMQLASWRLRMAMRVSQS